MVVYELGFSHIDVMSTASNTNVSKYEADFSVCLGSKLRKLRKERGLTQEAVANASGIAVYTYQKFEKGMSKPGTPMNPTLHTLHALCRVLDVKLIDLLDINISDWKSTDEKLPRKTKTR